MLLCVFFFFKQKTAYEMRISDWSSDVCSSDLVARAVDSPAIKILADLYHEQIQAGNLINTLGTCWDEIGYVQFGDNPGRKEPGSGEIKIGRASCRERVCKYV